MGVVARSSHFPSSRSAVAREKKESRVGVLSPEYHSPELLALLRLVFSLCVSSFETRDGHHHTLRVREEIEF